MATREYRCDFHIHTCLSPCADLDMYPRAIVARSLDAGLDIIGICDHNASENAEYVVKAAQGTPLTVLPGMEVTSREEVHLLALFDTVQPLVALRDMVYEHLPGLNDEALYGCQAVVNERDEVEGFNRRLLIGSTQLALHDIAEAVHRLDGMAIAAHVDRGSFGIIGQLGFIPENVHLDALEVSHHIGVTRARTRYPELAEYPLMTSSDAHRVEDIGRGSVTLVLARARVAECRLAFREQAGRRMLPK